VLLHPSLRFGNTLTIKSQTDCSSLPRCSLRQLQGHPQEAKIAAQASLLGQAYTNPYRKKTIHTGQNFTFWGDRRKCVVSTRKTDTQTNPR